MSAVLSHLSPGKRIKAWARELLEGDAPGEWYSRWSAGNDLLRNHDFVGVGLDDLVVQAVEGQLKAIGDAQLVVDLAQIVLDDLLGGAELERDFLIALALGDAGDDRGLLGREPGLGARADQRAAWAR